MRDLAPVDTFALCLLLLLSLVLPLMLSFRRPQKPHQRTTALALVWLGQFWIVLAALAILFASSAAPYALALGGIGCFTCARRLADTLKWG